MSAIWKRMDEKEEGFTLIELLVVVIIIGILAAIAIPVFLNQRTSAWRSAAESDARNAAIAVETFYTEERTYPTVAEFDAMIGDEIQVSTDVTLVYNPGGGSYEITATHDQIEDGVPVVARYDAGAGGIVDP